ncbi:hypothetical protein [Clostridium pasteurianum]|uniref:Uncharacterized protein n=1 Tax=Clostridium pasteurianum BC1 TaxID=86416 RepID=R4K3S2_CLOPA|nr:hypothetical protein [Clostridium pasteurianum]AGK96366.1 hypothetical protein Clopa_1388 [Clostridium pasteurianum BC1]
MGRKSIFDTEKAIDLLTKGFKQKDIAIQLGIKESTLKMYLKRNHSDKLEKIRENRKKNIKNDSEFELEHSNLLSVDDLKELREEKNYGIDTNESIGDYAFLMWNRQSYKKGKGKKFIFDESRGVRTREVPTSY